MISLDKVTESQLFSYLWKKGDLSYLRHPNQIKYKEFLDSTEYIIRVLHAGRGWGKTWDRLIDHAEFCIKNPGSRTVYAAQTRESVSKIVLPTWRLITQNVPEHVLPKWHVQGHSLIYENGSQTVLEGADDDHGNKLRGPFAHKITLDEAGFYRDLIYVVRSILLPQAQRVNGKIDIVSTSPVSIGHDFYLFVNECKNNGTYYKQTVYDNPRLSEAQIAEYAAQYGGESSTMFRREYLCEAVIDETRSVVPEFQEKLHVVDNLVRPDFYDAYCVMDLGLVDYTHVVLGYYDFLNATICIEDEIVQNYKTTDDLAAKIKAKELELYPRRTVKRFADNELQQLTDLSITHHLHFAPAVKYNKEAALNDLRLKFQQDKIKISRKCVNLIHQLSVGIWNNRRTDYERLPGAGHLDGVDAMIYLVRSIDYNHNPVPVGYGHSVHTHQTTNAQVKSHPMEGLVSWYGKR